MELALEIFVVGLLVGSLGSMLGIGGGVLLIPLLTALFGISIKRPFMSSFRYLKPSLSLFLCSL